MRAPDEPGVLQIAYTASNKRGGRDTGVLTVTVSADAPVLPPIARDIVVPATDTLDRTEVSVDVLAVAQNPSGPLSDLEVSVPGSQSDVVRVSESGEVVVTLVDHAQTVPYVLTNRTGTSPVASYAFITVPALGFFRPVPRPKAPELRVASGERLVIPLDEQVQVAPGRTARIADALGVSATRSDGTSPIVDDETLQFTSAPGYAGPASITVPVTDASSPGDTVRADVGHHAADHRVRRRRLPADLRRRRSSTWLPGSRRSPSTSGPSPRGPKGRTRRTAATRTRWSRRSPPGSRAPSPTAC